MRSAVSGRFCLYLSASALAFGCTRAPAPAPRVAGAPGPAARAPLAVAKPAETPAHISARPAPPLVTEPMAGSPDARALAEARLVTSSCEDAEAAALRQVEARVAKMRAELEASYQRWKAAQPGCWQAAEMERRYRRLGGHGYGVARGYAGGGHGVGGLQFASARPAPAASAARTDVAKSAQPREAKREAQAAQSASGTNTQVAGVDEADIVKNDGRYVYVAMNGALRIIEALRPRVLSETKLPGSVREMFVEGDRAVVYVAHGGTGAKRCTYGYDCQFAGDGSRTEILVLDVRDRTAPRIVREIGLSGSLMAARRIGRAVHTVVSDLDAPGPGYSVWPADLPGCGARGSDARTAFKKLEVENIRKIGASTSLPVMRDLGVEKPLCDHLLETPQGDGQAYTTVVSFDMTSDGTPAQTTTLMSRPGAVFASSSGLYVATVHDRANAAGGRWYSFHASSSEVSDIHKFRIGESLRDTRYVGSGTVPGHVLNQFSMDEYYGYLRIATTQGRVPDPKVQSSVSVLAEGAGGNLVRVGAVEGLAPGEDIRAVRFDDDRGYVVTFKKTDPLFVLDLYHPARPAVLGELKIPGFSTYMHRIDPDHLLSIGFDANDHGDFAYFDGVILQLFDVSVPTEPRLLHKEKIGTRGSSSEAATNHLAFNYFAEKNLLAIPMTVCEGGGDGRNGNQLAFSGLLVYDVSLKSGFSRLGGVNHGTVGQSCGTWWSNATSQVKRSIFLDDLVYSIATDRLKVQRMSHFGEDVANIAL